MLQNARVKVFTVSEILRENQQCSGGKTTPPPPHPPLQHTQIRVKVDYILNYITNKISEQRKLLVFK